MLKKLFILLALSITGLFSTAGYTYGIVFNIDLQKVESDYYYYAGFYRDMVAQSVKDGSWNILKTDGRIINLKGDYLAYAGMEGKNLNFDDDYYRFVIGNESYHTDNSTRFIYVDRDGLECFVDGYKYVDPTKEKNYYILRNDNGNGYVAGLYHKYDKKAVIPAIYDTLIYSSDDRITARKIDKYGIMNITQEVIIPFEYKYLDYINDNFIIAVNDIGRYGVINIKNEVIYPFEYYDIYNIPENEGYLRILKDGKFGLINSSDSKIIIPLEYDDIIYSYSHTAVALKDGKYGVINLRNEIIVPFIYEAINYSDSGFTVYKDDLAGFIDRQGKEVLPTEYYSILDVEGGLITAVIAEENGDHKYVTYNLKGEEVTFPSDEGSGSNDIIRYARDILPSKSYNDVSIMNINGDDLIVAKYKTEGFGVKFDYFRQTKGPSDWAVKEISEAIENNLIPKDYQSLFTFNIKRYEFCRIIVSFLEQYLDTTLKDIIKNNNIDVYNTPIIDEFNADIAVCLHLGIVNGRGNGIFDGESEITREEAAVMLTNLAKYLELYTNTYDQDLSDKEEVSSWAVDAVNFVLESKIMQGVGSDMFSPKTNITREQTYIIMNRMLNDSKFYALFNKAAEAWGWFYLYTMPLKGTPGLPLVGIETEAGVCFEVEYEGIETLKDLEDYLKTIFPAEFADGMLKSGRYFDVDGRLCAVAMERGSSHKYGKMTDVYTNNVSDNKTEYVVTVEKWDINLEVDGYEEFTFVYEKIGDRWVFTEFPAWW